MDFSEFKQFVQSEFPIPFDELLITDQVDGILNNAVTGVLQYVEKTKVINIASSQVIEDAISVVNCIPTYSDGVRNTRFSIWRSGNFNSEKVSFYFEPSTKMLSVGGSLSYRVTYVIDPSRLTIEDLNYANLNYAKDLAIGLLSKTEGYAGTRAVLTALPFEFNYEDLKNDGIEQIKEIKEELKEKYFGLYVSRR